MGLGEKLENLSRHFGYDKGFLEHLALFMSIKNVYELLITLRHPGQRYFIRVNTLKISVEELLDLLRGEGYEIYRHKVVREAIFLKVKGPFSVRIYPKKIIVDKHAAESVYMGANLYAPGIKKLEKIKRGDKVTIFSPNGIPVAEGIAVMSFEEIVEKWKGLAVLNTRSVYRVPSLRDHEVFYKGYIYHQSLPSMASLNVLNPTEGSIVLDMCAAPGGKATHAAQLMKDRGEIIAVDRSDNKVEKIRKNAERLGIRSIRTIKYESRYISDIVGINSVDYVILDPPCTALGVRPKLYYERTRRDIINMSNYQRQFLSEAYKVLRKGGKLLYTTCTLTLEENELNMIYAVEKLGFKIIDITQFPLGKSAFLGVPGIRFHPKIHDTPGFFIALLKKKE